MLGDGAIVNTGAIVEHDCAVGAAAHIAPRATLGGDVTVGDGAHVGMGAVVVEGVRLGAGAFVAAGAVVVEGRARRRAGRAACRRGRSVRPGVSAGASGVTSAWPAGSTTSPQSPRASL